MKAFAITLAAWSLFAGSFSHAGGEVGNGGDAVECGVDSTSAFNGDYSLDYLLTFRSENNNADVVQVTSWEQSRDRILALLQSKYPDLARSFGEFIADMDNRSDYLRPRIWLEAGFGLVQISDQKIIRKLPKNCIHYGSGGIVEVMQSVIRQRRPDLIAYQYDPAIYTGLRANAPLQFSFLMIHEWLWDLTDDVQIVRETDRFLHSSELEKLDGPSLRRALVHIGLDLHNRGFLPVCQRTSQVRAALEDLERKACQDITAFTYPDNRFHIDLTGANLSALQLGDFSGLGRLGTIFLNNNHLGWLYEDEFSGLYSLQYLDLTGNDLTELPPELLTDLHSINTLTINGNRLASVPSHLLDPVAASLKVLNLKDNQLENLPKDLFARFKATGLSAHGITVELSGNPMSQFDGDVLVPLYAINDCVTINMHGTTLTQEQKTTLHKRFPGKPTNYWHLELN